MEESLLQLPPGPHLQGIQPSGPKANFPSQIGGLARGGARRGGRPFANPGVDSGGSPLGRLLGASSLSGFLSSRPLGPGGKGPHRRLPGCGVQKATQLAAFAVASTLHAARTGEEAVAASTGRRARAEPPPCQRRPLSSRGAPHTPRSALQAPRAGAGGTELLRAARRAAGECGWREGPLSRGAGDLGCRVSSSQLRRDAN